MRGIAVVVLVVVLFSFGLRWDVHGYHNYTVGDSVGWYPKADYQNWASHINNFNLGDFLIFNTDNNHSVVQTYNLTTYKLCDYDNALDNDTVLWTESDPSSIALRPVSVAVPLLKTGPVYFFSSDYDGEQCKNGQHFSINVAYGQGLRTDNSAAPVSPQSGDDDSVPDTLVPSNFDDPKDIDDDQTEPSQSSTILPSISTLSFGLMFLVSHFIYI